MLLQINLPGAGWLRLGCTRKETKKNGKERKVTIPRGRERERDIQFLTSNGAESGKAGLGLYMHPSEKPLKRRTFRDVLVDGINYDGQPRYLPPGCNCREQQITLRVRVGNEPGGYHIPIFLRDQDYGVY